MRTIDADALRERLQSLAYDDWNQGVTTSFADACNEIIDVVEDQPTIKPERKTGKWIPCSERLPEEAYERRNMTYILTFILGMVCGAVVLMAAVLFIYDRNNKR